ncbi:MAG: hypothetical protein ABII82_02355 [Verrucomicrobiota bacterium]
MNSPRRTLCRWLGIALLPVLVAPAETPPPQPAPQRGGSGPANNIPGIFGTELPDLLNPENLRLSLRPHFGDFVNHDHFRLDVGLRYALSERLEFTIGTEAYVAHGLGDAAFGEKLGLASVEVGAKYRFAQWLQPYWQTAAGIKYTTPVSRPPLEFTDAYRNLTPYLTLAHDWRSRPDFTSFLSAGFNVVDRARVTGNPDSKDFGEHSWFIRPGLLWRRGDIHYTLETVVASTSGFEDAPQWQFSLRPGIEWDLPPALKFNARNRWTIGLGLSLGTGDQGDDVGVNVRIQTDFDFRKFFQRLPGVGDDPTTTGASR